MQPHTHHNSLAHKNNYEYQKIKTLEEEIFDVSKIECYPEQILFNKLFKDNKNHVKDITLTRPEINEEIKLGDLNLFNKLMGVNFSRLSYILIQPSSRIYTLEWFGFLNAPFLHGIQIKGCNEITSLNSLKKLRSKHFRSILIEGSSIVDFDQIARVQIEASLPIIIVFRVGFPINPSILKGIARSNSAWGKISLYHHVVNPMACLLDHVYDLQSKNFSQDKTLIQVQLENLDQVCN